MAKSKQPEYRQARLSAEDMRTAIQKIDRRIADLESFDINGITQYGDAKVQALEAKLDALLVSVFGADTVEYQRYRHEVAALHPAYFYPDMPVEEVRGVVGEAFVRSKEQLLAIKSLFLEELEDVVAQITPAESTPSAMGGSKVFIVHGHDDALKHDVARFIERLSLEPVILHEQPNQGQTIIEKFEGHAGVGFAVVLLTPDDIGGAVGKVQNPRARQNVILELGYFIGKLSRQKVCALYFDGVELPSDLSGVIYIKLDDAGAWKFQLAKELKASGIDVDLNKAI